MPDPWQDDLDSVLGGVARLNDTLKGLPKDQAGQISTRLRDANRQVWSMVNALEAHQVEHLYDTHAMLRAVAAKTDQLDLAELWVSLIQSGVLKLAPKALIEFARKRGVNPDKYLTTKEEE
jgi:hypothetical protein